MTRYRIALTQPDRHGRLWISDRGGITGCPGRAATFRAAELPDALEVFRKSYPDLTLAAEEANSNGENDPEGA